MPCAELPGLLRTAGMTHQVASLFDMSADKILTQYEKHPNKGSALYLETNLPKMIRGHLLARWRSGKLTKPRYVSLYDDITVATVWRTKLQRSQRGFKNHREKSEWNWLLSSEATFAAFNNTTPAFVREFLPDLFNRWYPQIVIHHCGICYYNPQLNKTVCRICGIYNKWPKTYIGTRIEVNFGDDDWPQDWLLNPIIWCAHCALRLAVPNTKLEQSCLYCHESSDSTTDNTD